MPFTPLHMGPGLLVKALLQGSFSLMVFGITFEFTGLRGFSRRSGGMMGWALPHQLLTYSLLTARRNAFISPADLK